MITGDTVFVQLRVATGKTDERENLLYEHPEVEVKNVLIAPVDPQDVIESNRDGVEVKYTLHFPKTYTESLAGLKVRVYGDLYKVVGDPKPYQSQNTPGPWNRPVRVGVNRG